VQHDLELGYLVLEVPDPDSLSPVFADVVGLLPGAPTDDGSLTWRNDASANRLFVRAGPANDAVAIGVEATDAAVFDAVVDRLRTGGAEVVEGDGSGRRVRRLVRTAAPWGLDIEVVLGLADAPGPFSSELVPGGFLTDGVGFGHVVLATTAFDESASFLTDGLGFRQSDWSPPHR
jgi:biphenyl-2,3-diol 1,2-dioxygenase